MHVNGILALVGDLGELMRPPLHALDHTYLSLILVWRPTAPPPIDVPTLLTN